VICSNIPDGKAEIAFLNLTKLTATPPVLRQACQFKTSIIDSPARRTAES
jgi:hypothetical protein